ncbi:MAG: methyltransferase domain-containing protein [Polyangiaceae bacterium]|nr:methyltransferase domain-containing protein [Polyangiaceae bacterium]
MRGAAMRMPSVPLDEVLPPTYVAGGARSDVFAHFRSGLIVRAGRSRARTYPGLRGAAPPTTVFYGIACQLPDVDHVLDVGCGSGDGTRRLCTRFTHVTGVDNSAEALVFAREWCPRARFLQADVTGAFETDPADLAVIADLLGQLRHPELALRNARSRLGPAGRVLVAEPLAIPLQRLGSPARRAQSLRSLEALLVRSGLRLRDWVSKRGTFVACIAEVAEGAGTDSLLAGLDALRAGDPAAARAAFDVAAGCGSKPIEREALLGSAQAALVAGDGDAAARALMSAASLDPNDARPLAGLAELSFLTSDLPTALRLGLEAAQRDPCEPSASRIAAFAALALGHRDAMSAIRVANNLAPDDFDLARALSEAASRLGDGGPGVAALERVRAYGDDHGASLHVELARALLAQGRRADAELEARLARARHPEDPDVIELWSSFPGRVAH